MNQKDSIEFLYKKYLNTKGDPLEKIVELRRLAGNDADRLKALRKLQIALLLEKQVPQPSDITFDLNLFTGEMIGTINKGYALGFFRRATEIAKRIKSVPPSRLFHLYTNQAGSHQYLLEYDSARFYYDKALHTARLDNPISVASTYNNIGLFFNEIQSYDSARIYYQKALITVSDKEKHPEFYASISENIALLDMREGNFEEAVKVFNENDSIYLILGLPEHYVVNKVRLLRAMDKLNDPAVDHQIMQLQKFVDENESRIADKRLLDFYQFANDYYFNKADRTNQLFYRSRYKILNDKVEEKNIEQLDQLAKTLLDIQASSLSSDISAYQLRDEKQQIQLKSIRFVAIAATVSLLLIIFSLVMYMRKRRFENQIARQMAEAELKTKEMEARLLQQDLELKKRDLTNVVLHNTQVYDTNQKLIERIEEIRKNKNSQDDELRSLLIDLQSKTQISDRTIGLQSNIDSVNAEFHERLKSNFPDLTKSEEELCGYIRINLSTKDISILKNVAASSVKMSKTRLRKKLGVTPEEDLYEFMRMI